jgi:two-component system sensor histidine kinase BaeS
VRIDVDLPESLPGVQADGRALRRAVDNLVANALKHGGAGRWVGLAARAVRGRGREEVQVTVSDRGAGIDPADLAHIFEPFYRGRRAVSQQVRGNGLGLSLVRRIVEMHDGRVAVTSAPGQGASFRIQLPAAGAAGAGEQAEAPSGRAPAEPSA